MEYLKGWALGFGSGALVIYGTTSLYFNWIGF